MLFPIMDNMHIQYVQRYIDCTWNSRLTSTSSRSSGDLGTGSIRHEQKDLKFKIPVRNTKEHQKDHMSRSYSSLCLCSYFNGSLQTCFKTCKTKYSK